MHRSTETSLAGLRILVVEDEYLLADDLVEALRAAGAEPIGPVATLAQAEKRIAEDRPDAAVLDMNLRGESAFTLAEHAVANDVRCVIVSGYSEQALPPSLIGLRRFEKPVNPSMVVAAIGEEMAGAGARLS